MRECGGAVMHSQTVGADNGLQFSGTVADASCALQGGARSPLARANAVEPHQAAAVERVEGKVFKYVAENRVRHRSNLPVSDIALLLSVLRRR